MKVETCSFSGYKIYPGKVSRDRLMTRFVASADPPTLRSIPQGKLYIRSDSKVYRFVTSKEESLFLQRKNPRKIAWTVVYRRVNKKGVTEEVAKKRSRKNVKHQRGIVGADLSSILAKRNQKPEVRTAQREAALQAGKDKKKDKKALKSTPGAKPVAAKQTRAKSAPRTGGLR
ncbi:BZ3500_MvSof-1268-A1-R1_Chr4-3g07257 [Microbotryum saponariae]|uniref:BZ3500_MvSof-1268-A1-R1_Chr4-3g07257 protein n=1 Tax=Microbotryum saponariae TaxID=289078 RepID=A0A2X0KUF9_9BASI|nr:BZ3500_MvSof-1268-A1-R1_Chr4-3g07257 [Microbotryum saponariae]SDA06920.1 BZ3501_MvSof-1269-A2-R1_Chr4-2g06966 [Microbotryum saponariae]